MLTNQTKGVKSINEQISFVKNVSSQQMNKQTKLGKHSLQTKHQKSVESL